MKRRLTVLVFISLSICACNNDLKSFLFQNPIFENAVLAGTIAEDSRGVPMAFVPAGTFTMGIDLDSAIEECQRRVAEYPIKNADCRAYFFETATPAHQMVLDAFWIDQFEVTFGQWMLCVEAGACENIIPRLGFSIETDEMFPYNIASFNDAAQFCEWRNARLPTEAEWEYAARGPHSFLYPWGNEFHADYTNVCDINCPLDDASWDDNYRFTAPIGSYATDKSWVGVYDMLGNLSEWVEGDIEPYDDYEYDLANHRVFAPDQQPLATVRGGNYLMPISSLSNTSRAAGYHDEVFNTLTVGFRCARTPDEQMPIPTTESMQ